MISNVTYGPTVYVYDWGTYQTYYYVYVLYEVPSSLPNVYCTYSVIKYELTACCLPDMKYVLCYRANCLLEFYQDLKSTYLYVGKI